VTATADSAAGPAPAPTIRLEDINTPTSGPGEHFARYDELRAKGDVHFGLAGAEDNPFWLVSRIEDIRTCFGDPSTFSNSAVTPDTPNPPYLWIPEMLDPPLHTKWRQKLGPFFAPGAVDRLKPRVHEVMDEIHGDHGVARVRRGPVPGVGDGHPAQWSDQRARRASGDDGRDGLLHRAHRRTT
jgi:cytochrome P450